MKDILSIIGFVLKYENGQCLSYKDYVIDIVEEYAVINLALKIFRKYRLSKDNKFIYGSNEEEMCKYLKNEFRSELRKYKINKLLNV